MNTDCFAHISQFMPRKEAVKLTTETAAMNFPKKVVLKSFDEARQFYNWCQTFDTSNLEEVSYVICDMRWEVVQEGAFVGWTPPSVKKLTIDVYNHCDYYILDGIEDLTINRASEMEFHLPDSIKRLRLEKRFEGRIAWWPDSLEHLHINSWAMPYGGDGPDVLELPDGVREIYIDYGVPVEVHVWPAALERLTLIECDDDAVANWLCMTHGDIPEGVKAIRKRVPY
jgi:hypothetical protein